MQHRELERQRLSGGQTVFIAEAFFFLPAVGAFKTEHMRQLLSEL